MGEDHSVLGVPLLAVVVAAAAGDQAQLGVGGVDVDEVVGELVLWEVVEGVDGE